MRRIVYSKAAVKMLGRMPSNLSKLVREKVHTLALTPEVLANNVKALRGAEGLFRLRIGDWRVIFRQTSEFIEVEGLPRAVMSTIDRA